MINIIAAVARNGVIGAKGSIPWDIPEDRKYFRELTTGNVCVMGRKTYESVGGPLPDRINIVISSSASFSADNLRTVRSFREAMTLAKTCAKLREGMEIFLCGGGSVYAEGLSVADKLYLTELDDEYEGETRFPDLTGSGFMLKRRERCDDLRLSFCVYEKRK